MAHDDAGAFTVRAAPSAAGLPAELLARAHVRLNGDVNEQMFNQFDAQLQAARDAETVVVELTTCGGGAETGRRIAEDIRLLRRDGARRVLFLGKTVVYSAGVTIMSAFPRQDRYLTRDTVLLIHGRRMNRQVQLSGPLRASAQVAREVLAEIEFGLELERRGFTALVEGSDVDVEECCERATSNWYVTAEMALERGLVAGLI